MVYPIGFPSGFGFPAVLWSDPTIGIDWPLSEIGTPLLSATSLVEILHNRFSAEEQQILVNDLFHPPRNLFWTASGPAAPQLSV